MAYQRKHADRYLHSAVPIIEDSAARSSVIKYTIAGVVGLPLVIGCILLPFDIIAAAVMAAAALIDAAVMHAVIPKRFQIFENRLRIILGRPFSMTVFFNDIESIQQAEKDTAWAYTGIRFVTSSKFVIEIKRKSGLDIIFSPSGGEDFLDELIRTKIDYREPDFSVFLKK